MKRKSVDMQQIKKGEVTSFKTVTSSEEPHVEVESINQRKITQQSVADQTGKFVICTPDIFADYFLP